MRVFHRTHHKATKRNWASIRSLTIVVLLAALVKVNVAMAGTTITAPLFPLMVPGLTEFTGNKYPLAAEDQLNVAQQFHLTYQAVKTMCSELPLETASGKARETDIELIKASTLKAPTNTESPDVFREVAKCSYKEFSAKPYYIPQLVDDVDMCREIVGPNYRMISEADIHSFSGQFYTELNKVFANQQKDIKDTFYLDFYFSRATYIRGSDGTLKIGNLYPNVFNSRITEVDGKWDLGPDTGPNRLLLSTTLDVGHIDGTFVPILKDVKVGLRCMLIE